ERPEGVAPDQRTHPLGFFAAAIDVLVSVVYRSPFSAVSTCRHGDATASRLASEIHEPAETSQWGMSPCSRWPPAGELAAPSEVSSFHYPWGLPDEGPARARYRDPHCRAVPAPGRSGARRAGRGGIHLLAFVAPDTRTRDVQFAPVA